MVVYNINSQTKLDLFDEVFHKTSQHQLDVVFVCNQTFDFSKWNICCVVSMLISCYKVIYLFRWKKLCLDLHFPIFLPPKKKIFCNKLYVGMASRTPVRFVIKETLYLRTYTCTAYVHTTPVCHCYSLLVKILFDDILQSCVAERQGKSFKRKGFEFI